MPSFRGSGKQVGTWTAACRRSGSGRSYVDSFSRSRSAAQGGVANARARRSSSLSPGFSVSTPATRHPFLVSRLKSYLPCVPRIVPLSCCGPCGGAKPTATPGLQHRVWIARQVSGILSDEDTKLWCFVYKLSQFTRGKGTR